LVLKITKKGGEYLKIFVVDSIMGSGKTSAAISQMNEDWDSNYIFITPYLKEVDRIKSSCANRKFIEPENKGKGKLENLHNLLGKGNNIASTHALFKAYSEYTKDLIKLGNYKLILDEVFEVLEIIPLHKDDIKLLLSTGLAHIDDNNFVIWDDNSYKGEKFSLIKSMSETRNLILIDNMLMAWNFPIDIFEAFQEIYILTYMFDAQIQKYYYDLNNVSFQYIGVENQNGYYRFSATNIVPEYVKELKYKIHILEDDKLNKIGDKATALSSSWYDRESDSRNKPMLKMLQNNLYNVFEHRFKTNSELNMWTAFKDFRGTLKGKGYTKGFVSCNARATNEYRHKKSLAYCLNVYFNPYIKNYFLKRDIAVKEDKYALSELIQWIWRSAIRDNQEIHIYIPSSRMRNLLKIFLDEL
jgi:hypothetical protein